MVDNLTALANLRCEWIGKQMEYGTIFVKKLFIMLYVNWKFHFLREGPFLKSTSSKALALISDTNAENMLETKHDQVNLCLFYFQPVSSH